MRWIYEKFNIYIYIIVPLIVVSLSSLFIQHIQKQGLQQHSVEISLAFLGVFLTLMGILVAFPSSKRLELLQRYKYTQIAYLTLVFGIIFAIALLISALVEYHEYSYYLFVALITETLLATKKLYSMAKFINKKK